MKRKERSRRIFLPRAIIALAVSVVSSVGQVPTGTIGGAVMDQSDAAIQDANVTVVNRETGALRSTNSDSGGLYLVADLPPGPYEVRGGAKGFRTLVQTVIIWTGHSTRVDLRLPLGVVEQVVETTDRIRYESPRALCIWATSQPSNTGVRIGGATSFSTRGSNQFLIEQFTGIQSPMAPSATRVPIGGDAARREPFRRAPVVRKRRD